MPTARERMLTLTSLPQSNTARVHFLSIQQNRTIQLFEVMEAELEMAEYEVVMEPEFTVNLQEDEHQVHLEPNEYDVEIC